MSAMTPRTARLITAGLVALALTIPVGAAAQEQWKIYLKGKVEPIDASFYAEESPWIFYRDDESMYVFALGCNRIDRVERGGTPIPTPACAVEPLPTTAPRIILSIMDLEAKRLDDSIAKLREQIRAYFSAVIGGEAAAIQVGQRQMGAEEQRLAEARLAGVVAFLQSQINDTLFDIRLTEQRVGALADAAKGFPPRTRQRFYFAPK